MSIWNEEADYEIQGDTALGLLRDIRGGCRCRDPNAHPPCGVCTTPATNDEIDSICHQLGSMILHWRGQSGDSAEYVAMLNYCKALNALEDKHGSHP